MTEDGDRISANDRIDGDKRQPFKLRLGHQHPVEGILVVRR